MVVDKQSAEDQAAGFWSSIWWRPLAFIVAVLMAVLGQALVSGRQQTAVGATLLAAACGIFVFALARSGKEILNPSPPFTQRPAAVPLIASRFWSTAYILIGLLLAVLAFVGFSGNDLAGGLWFWLGAITYYVIGTVERPRKGLRQMIAELPAGNRWPIFLAFSAIMVITVFFRTYRLADIPAEMTSDHAEKLLDVYDVLNGQRTIYFPRNTGREALQFYLTAWIVKATSLPLGHLALKAGTALFSILTIPFAYLVGRDLYGRPAGLLAAFFLSVSHWHVAISRVGLRFPFTAAFSLPALHFLWRALRFNRRNDWLAAGLVLGFGLHTYTAMRIVPLLFLTWVGLRVAGALWSGRRFESETGRLLPEGFWTNALAGGMAAMLAYLPLLRYMLDEPAMFWYRAASRAQESLSPIETLGIFLGNVWDALLMFNYRGDVVPANTIPGTPQMGLVSGGLFIVGLSLLIWRGLRRRDSRTAYLLSALIVLLLPSVLSLAFPAENPSAVRTGGAIPFAMLIAALPLAVTVEQGARLRGNRQALVYGVLALLLITAFADNYRWYFNRYDRHIRRSIWNATEIGAEVRNYVAEGGALENVYHIAYPHWVDTRNIAINAGDITWHNAVLDPGELARHGRESGPRLYILHPDDQASLFILREVFPQGRLRQIDSDRPGKEFLLFEVTALND